MRIILAAGASSLARLFIRKAVPPPFGPSCFIPSPSPCYPRPHFLPRSLVLFQTGSNTRMWCCFCFTCQQRRANMQQDEAPKKKTRFRPDHDGTHRKAFERAKRAILASETICGICGLPVDKSLKYPDPMAPCIDHIIPIDRGGHPSDRENLQLAHWKCNRAKSDKILN